jgi:hypothetical protein
MKLVCPYCTREIKAEEAQWTADWLEYRDLAARLGKHAALTEEYAEHFRARSGRMTLKKKLRIIRAVARLLDDGRFQYAGKHYRADQQSVLQALRTTIDSTEPPLKNHNYLKAILAKGNEKVDAQGLSAEEERRREERRRRGDHRHNTVPGSEHGPLCPEEAKRRLGKLAENIG